MSKRKSSSGDMSKENAYQNVQTGVNNSKPRWETSHIEREEGKHGISKWCQIWRYNPNGTLYITYDSRVGDIQSNGI